ncbi:NS2 [Green River chinook virus]|uniref:NS2 n=1 Tax=Green River chinook virus TaxID=1382300 RepID=W6EMI2_9REOV|nr:NS2 [Green River chinook virus]AHJ14808.1 NS2 [Green River chinook virus]
MSSTSATLITQERTERVSRLLELYPTLTVTLRQDTAQRGTIESNYSSSGLNGALRSLNPLAATHNFHAIGYVRPDPEAARAPPLRTLLSAGLDTALNHSCQCDVTPALRDFVKAACPLWFDDILPTSMARIAPLALASRISMAAAGINPVDLSLQHPSPTSTVVAFTSKVLGIFVDLTQKCVSVSSVPAARLIESVDSISAVITNYGYEMRGQVRRDGPTCLSPNDLADRYDMAWISAIVLLIAYQAELDLSAVALAPSDRLAMATHTAAVDVLVRRLQRLSPFSSRIMHLCVAHATNPFRNFDDLVMMWQKPDRFPLPPLTIQLSGSALEVVANGGQLFRIGAVMVGGT